MRSAKISTLVEVSLKAVEQKVPVEPVVTDFLKRLSDILKTLLFGFEARAGAVVPHAGICAGVAGNRHPYRDR